MYAESERKQHDDDTKPQRLTGAPDKEYQSLFWVPMLYQTAESATALVEGMLESIEDFYDGDNKANTRKSILSAGEEKGGQSTGPKKRRQQILGDDSVGNEVVATRVEVVTKSDDTVFVLLSVLKQHFLFSKLHDYELEDVIDSMMDEYFEEGENIMCEGDAGDKFYVLEHGNVEILIQDNVVGRLPPGSSFGDLALMYNSPRAGMCMCMYMCMCGHACVVYTVVLSRFLCVCVCVCFCFSLLFLPY